MAREIGDQRDEIEYEKEIVPSIQDEESRELRERCLNLAMGTATSESEAKEIIENANKYFEYVTKGKQNGPLPD